jgi:hypothetical protein
MDDLLDLRPLELLASSIAGRSVVVAPAAAGSRTWTDGRTIYLEPAPASDRLRLLGAQASLLAADSLSAAIAADLRRHRPLAGRYLAVEGHRALAANERALPPWMRSMIDRGLAERAGSPAESLAVARNARGLEPDWALGAIDPRRLAEGAGRSEPTILEPRVGLDATDPAELEALDDDSAEANAGNVLSSPIGGSSALGRLMAKLLRPTRSHDGGGDPGADAPTHRGSGRPSSGRSVAVGRLDHTTDGSEPDASTSRHSYPEWDDLRQAYRPDWCQVHEGVAEVDPTGPAALPDRIALRRALTHLGTDLRPCRGQRQGDDLDVDAVVESRVDRLAGGPHVDEVYIDQLRSRRDLSVLVLLDISGSAAEPGVAGRTVHDHQSEVAATLTTALHRLGDRVALYAFNSRGRTAVQMARVKAFDDLLDDRVARRISGLRPGAFTRLGAAVRHGSTVLEAHGGTRQQLLVVLSDGFAYDHGYEGRYGEADARRALLEARRRGVGCLCLSIGADADLAALQRVFGTAAHARVATADALPACIAPLFASALRSAHAQRRTFQRTERTRARLRVDGAIR